VRITLIGIASKYIHQNLAPWCLKAGLNQYGAPMPCHILELNINQPILKALAALMDTKPQLAGFSCYIWNIRMVRSLAASLKLLSPETVIVLGGPEAGSRPESILEEIPQADYVITGPGEYAFAELCKRLDDHQDVSGIPGLAYNLEGGIVKNPPAPLPLTMPSPLTKECLQNLKGRIAYAETSRGCPFHCSFCLSGQDEGVTLLPMDQAKETLLAAASSGAKTVKLVDRTFNCNRERAYEIFRFLMEKHREGAFQNVCFHFEVAADLFDRDTLLLLKSAPPGLFQMEAGLQSFHEQTLYACRRKTDLNKLCDNIAFLLSGQNIHLHLDLIAGLPYEDFQTFGESVNRALPLKPHMLQLGFLKLLHGSYMISQREEFGILHDPDPPYEVMKTRWLSFDDICKLKKCEEALDKLYNSGKFRRTLDLVFRDSGITPFDLFLQMGGIFDSHEGGLSLDQTTELAFSFMQKLPHISKGALRDALAFDRLSADNTGRLPECLHIPDIRLGQALSQLKKEHEPGAKLGACILYDGGERLLWTDYTRRHPVTGEYDIKTRPL
jgi:radical SAM superfamily enzyme YgiQ (UPF0313 family)